MTGKLAGGWCARTLAGRARMPDLGVSLLSPGIVGIAFALNALRAAGPDAGALIAIVVVGGAASEVVALLVRPHEGAAE
jgi:hypothetical protein